MKQQVTLVNDMRETEKVLRYSFKGIKERSNRPLIDGHGRLTNAGAELLGNANKAGMVVDSETAEKMAALESLLGRKVAED